MGAIKEKEALKFNKSELEVVKDMILDGYPEDRIAITLGITARTFYERLQADPDLQKEISDLRLYSCDNAFHSLRHIADDCPNDILKARLQSENIKHITSRLNPRKYGDKIQIDLQTVDLSPMLDAADARLERLTGPLVIKSGADRAKSDSGNDSQDSESMDTESLEDLLG